ncbi:MAG TPA: chemotaxis protein CheD [Rhodocyclaceae bacterium]|nr:chemotaxis protein CheD [Rhodocyclaceae bacterium]
MGEASGTIIETSHASGQRLERIAININPGGWATENHRPLATLLGSCVAVCLHDADMGIGGMNHFLLPSHRSGRHKDTDQILAGDYSMEVLLNALLAKGARKHKLVAKAFGGGNVVTTIRLAIGKRNAEFAREWLDREGIPLKGHDLGGPWSRKIVFVPATGEAYCRRISTDNWAPEIVNAEAALDRSFAIHRPAPEKKVELF